MNGSYNGCAGGGTTNITLPLELDDDVGGLDSGSSSSSSSSGGGSSSSSVSRTRCLLEVSGLRGGHSGVNIHE